MALAPLLWAAGCVTARTVTYDTTTVRPERAPRIEVALQIGPLRDARRRHRPSAVLFHGEREAEIDGQNACINAEANYADGVAGQVTRTVAAHLRQRGVLAKVSAGDSGRASYRLTGEITALYGAQEPSTAAAVGAAFGLIGALATAGVTTPGRVRIAFQNLQIEDASGVVVARPDDVVLDYSGKLPADAYCWSIYENVNAKLREAVAMLASNVERSLRSQQTGPREEQAAQRKEEQARRRQDWARFEGEHARWKRETEAVDDDRSPLTTAAWIAAGAGVALAGTGTYFLFQAGNADDEARAEAARWTTLFSQVERETAARKLAEYQSDRDLYGGLGASLLILGGASLATSVVLLIVRPGLPEEPVRPLVLRDGLGLTLGGQL